MDERHFRDLLKRASRGEASREEYQTLEKFLSKRSNKSGLSPENFIQSKKRIYSNLLATTKFEKRRFSPSLFMKYAAAILILTLSSISIYKYVLNGRAVNQPVQHLASAGMGEREEIILPDGSKVYLNSGSVLEYPEMFPKGRREVHLSGEAFFEVTHNKKQPFVVESGDVKTIVLGTTFNVSENESNVFVTVESGKVKVSLEDNPKEVFITKGEQARYIRKTKELTSSNVNVEIYTSWRNGLLYFDGIPMAQAIKKLEKWYGVNIEYEHPENADYTVVGKYQNEKLATILRGFEFMFDLEIQYKNDSVIKIK